VLDNKFRAKSKKAPVKSNNPLNCIKEVDYVTVNVNRNKDVIPKVKAQTKNCKKELYCTINTTKDIVKRSRRNKEILSQTFISNEYENTLNKPKTSKIKEELDIKNKKKNVRHQLEVAFRNTVWLKQKNAKITKRATEDQANKLIECTFQPLLKARGKRSKKLCRNKHVELTKEELNVLRSSNSYLKIYKVRRSKSDDKNSVK